MDQMTHKQETIILSSVLKNVRIDILAKSTVMMWGEHRERAFGEKKSQSAIAKPFFAFDDGKGNNFNGY
jgi:hypothetical protein